MLTQLTTTDRVVGAKQARRALSDGRGTHLYLAEDADPMLTGPLKELAEQRGVAITMVSTMRALGVICGISVGAAVAVTL